MVTASAVVHSTVSPTWITFVASMKGPVQLPPESGVAVREPSELQRAEVNVPDAIVDLFETDVLADAGVAEIDEVMAPANAAVGTDVTSLEVSGIF